MYLLENLEFLDVSNNQLRELPKTIGYMDRLQRLNVSGNELTELPAVFQNFALRFLLQIGKQFRASCLKFNMATYYTYPSRSLVDEMHQIAKELTAPAHGILITDDAPSQLDKQMEMFGLECCEGMRIAYRSMLFSTKDTLKEYVSGVAVHPEVLDQTTPNGCALHCQLRRKDILVGVTVDKGLVPLLCTYGEYTTQGLDELAGRCEMYKDCGCDYTMWRAQYNVSEFTPSYLAILENANTLAKFAAISQSKRMLPVIEVDIIPEEDSDLERLEKVTETVLVSVYKALFDHHVSLEATMLKVPALRPGPKCEKRNSPGQISRTTLRLLRHAVPLSVAGIILHVDGKTQDKSLCQLNALANDPSPKPWPLTFCIDSLMQASLIMTWAGQDKNVEKTQEDLLKLFHAFSQASQGSYIPGSMKSLVDQCYCKKALKNLKLTPPPLPNDCMKYYEICRLPTALAMASKTDKNIESSTPASAVDELSEPTAEVKVEDPSTSIAEAEVKEEEQSSTPVEDSGANEASPNDSAQKSES
ncbi:fructose-bisphosphate aldolase isoform X2 [Eurosta solidaginis]